MSSEHVVTKTTWPSGGNEKGSGSKVSVGLCCLPFLHMFAFIVQDTSKRLDLALWQQAWDRYALAAQVTGQMDFHLAMTHKAIVMDVANTAVSAEKRQRLLGVLYDEASRCVRVCLCISNVCAL